MAKVSITQLAALVRLEPEALLEQLKQAGVSVTDTDQMISDEEKRKLLMYLQKNRATASSSGSKITLQRKSSGIVRQGKKSVSVEFRKKRTFVRPSEQEVVEDAPPEDVKTAPETEELVAESVTPEVEEAPAIVEQKQDVVVEEKQKEVKKRAPQKQPSTPEQPPVPGRSSDGKRRRKKKQGHGRDDDRAFEDGALKLSPVRSGRRRKRKSTSATTIEHSFAKPTAPVGA